MNAPGHSTVLAAILAACLVPATAHAAATGEQLCEAAKLVAAAKYSQCRLKADAVFAKSDGAGPAVTKRDAAYALCSDTLQRSYARTEARYPLPAPEGCPSIGDYGNVDDYLATCTDEVANAGDTGEPLPTYEGGLTQCLDDVQSCHETVAGVSLANATFVDAYMDMVKLPGVPMDHASFHNVRMSESDLTDVDLRNARLTLTSISTTNLANANLSNAWLIGLRATFLRGCPAALPADWTCEGNMLIGPGADLSGTTLISRDLHGRNLDGINFQNADLSNANLSGARLGFVHNVVPHPYGFQYLNLANVNLDGANLTSANIHFDMTASVGGAARISGIRAVNLVGCPLSPAPFRCLRGALIGPRANVSGADLTGVDLTNHNMEGINMRGVYIPNATLWNVNLTGADLTNANLFNSNLGLANLTGVTWNNTTCPDTTNSNTNGTSPRSCCGHLGVFVPVAC